MSWRATFTLLVLALGTAATSDGLHASERTAITVSRGSSPISAVSRKVTGARSYLRPYGLDIGETVVLTGRIYCPLYDNICMILDEKAPHGAHGQSRVMISLAGLSQSRSDYLMQTCTVSTEACRDAVVTGKVIRGINEPIVLAIAVRFEPR